MKNMPTSSCWIDFDLVEFFFFVLFVCLFGVGNMDKSYKCKNWVNYIDAINLAKGHFVVLTYSNEHHANAYTKL